jgi:hypothetical protein
MRLFWGIIVISHPRYREGFTIEIVFFLARFA